MGQVLAGALRPGRPGYVNGSVFVGVATAVFGVVAIAIGVLSYIAESDEMADVG